MMSWSGWDRRRAVKPAAAWDLGLADRHPLRSGGAGDEALVDVVPVQVGPADRARAGVRPVDVAAVDRHRYGCGGAGDEALVDVVSVQVGPADRAGAGVRPVDVAALDRHRVRSGG